MLTDSERSRIEQILLQERERARDSMTELEEEGREMHQNAGELTNYHFHPADEGTQTEQQEKMFLLAQQQGRRQEEIDDALRRLRDAPDEFGTCERCGQPIGMARLEVVPEGRFCADCQRIVEGDSPA